ncbi:46207_t:CDS:2 [Gigaspora margarita]|uniref:46207_t:CDS:1 n=1 Tax=Gigaspora margarita TaxID=4874 RepID=A0ABN7WBM3_GIGMA|nr:46207_t:CDS:2 [Gigaspora margarita]
MAQKRKCKINVEIPVLLTHNLKRYTKIFPMGSNDCADFHIVKISCGSLHVAALTQDGKVITWGCNNEGALGRVMKSKDPNSTDENVLAFIQDLDDVVIVKVICGSNIMLALSDKGQLYATGTFRDNNRKTGFILAINKQSIFVKYGPTSHLKITDIAIGENYVLILTTNSYLYTFGCMDSYQLGRRISIHKPNGLMLTPIFGRENHSFAINENGMLYAWGQNMDSQCGIKSLNPIITPMKLEFFKNSIRVNQISVGLHHMLVLLKNSEVYSFRSTEYEQLGIGVSEENRKSPA